MKAGKPLFDNEMDQAFLFTEQKDVPLATCITYFCFDPQQIEVVLYAMALSDYPWVSTRLGTCKLFEPLGFLFCFA